MFHRAPGGRITEITFAVLGSTPSRGCYDPTKTASERRTQPWRESLTAINKLLAAAGTPEG